MSSFAAVTFREVARPLKITFSTSMGRKDFMSSVIVTVRTKEGAIGHGECPTSFILREETIPVIKAIIREAAPVLKSISPEDYSGYIEALRRRYRHNPMTISGIETALFRAYLQEKGISERAYFGSALDAIETDITVPFSTNNAALTEWIGYAMKRNFATYKLKVSGKVDEDKWLIDFVQERLKRSGRPFTLRLDGNQGFTVSGFLKFADYVKSRGYAVELFEQPLPKDDYKGLKDIKKRSPFPIILDETVFDEADLQRVLADDLGHGINIKIAKSGISRSLRLYQKAKESGLSLMIGCMTETMVGLSAGINMAAGLGGFDYIDLDSVHFLRRKKPYNGIKIAGPRYFL